MRSAVALAPAPYSPLTIVPGSIVSVTPDITAILPAIIYMESLDQVTSVVILLEIES